MSVIVAHSNHSTPKFGSDFLFVESLGVTTTTQTTFQEKLSLVTPAIDPGLYRIGWSFQWNHDSTVDDFEGRVQLNNVIDLTYIQAEPKDSAANNGAIGPNPGPFSTTGTDQRFADAGFAYQTLTAGVHTIDVDFRTNNTANESSIWNVRLEFWRVG